MIKVLQLVKIICVIRILGEREQNAEKIKGINFFIGLVGSES